MGSVAAFRFKITIFKMTFFKAKFTHGICKKKPKKIDKIFAKKLLNLKKLNNFKFYTNETNNDFFSSIISLFYELSCCSNFFAFHLTLLAKECFIGLYKYGGLFILNTYTYTGNRAIIFTSFVFIMENSFNNL